MPSESAWMASFQISAPFAVYNESGTGLVTDWHFGAGLSSMRESDAADLARNCGVGGILNITRCNRRGADSASCQRLKDIYALPGCQSGHAAVRCNIGRLWTLGYSTPPPAMV